MSLFKKDQERETSSGEVIGWVLLAFAAVLIVAFIVFAVIKGVSDKNTDEPKAVVEQTTDTVVDGQ